MVNAKSPQKEQPVDVGDVQRLTGSIPVLTTRETLTNPYNSVMAARKDEQHSQVAELVDAKPFRDKMQMLGEVLHYIIQVRVLS